MFAPRASSVISLSVKYLGLVLKKSSSQSMILSHTLRISHSGASSATQPVRKRAQSLDPPPALQLHRADEMGYSAVNMIPVHSPFSSGKRLWRVA